MFVAGCHGFAEDCEGIVDLHGQEIDPAEWLPSRAECAAIYERTRSYWLDSFEAHPVRTNAWPIVTFDPDVRWVESAGVAMVAAEERHQRVLESIRRQGETPLRDEDLRLLSKGDDSDA